MVTEEEFLEYYDVFSCCFESDSVFCNMIRDVWGVNRSQKTSHRQDSIRSSQNSRYTRSQKSDVSRKEADLVSRGSRKQESEYSSHQRSQRSYKEQSQNSQQGELDFKKRSRRNDF